jgi:UDP-glucuronate decarboxylase
MSQRILITGGAGFIGSHLCRRLVAAGKDVICLDNFFTSRKSNIAELLGEPNFELIRHDITQPIWVEVDQIYNLACPASPVHYQHNPIKTVKTSVLGAFNVLGIAKRIGARVLHTSTSEIYGDPEISPQREEYHGNVNPIGIRACYDEGKRCAETICFDYRRMHNVDVRVVRIFNTYGPFMHPYDGRVVSNFILSALCGDPLVLHGTGEQSRSFCYIDDLVEGLVRRMEHPESLEGPMNLGNPTEITIAQLANTVKAMTESRSKVSYVPSRADDPKQRKPDISFARKELGWTPKISLDEGLRKTIRYFRDEIDLTEFRPPTENQMHPDPLAKQKKNLAINDALARAQTPLA